MPSINPLGHRLTKDSLANYAISVTYNDIPSEPDFFECSVEITSTVKREANGREKQTGTPKKTSDGWFSGFFSQESVAAVDSEPQETRLLLGYVQLLGYIRLNNHVGTDGSSNPANNPYWKNSQYLEMYGKEDLDVQIDTVRKTPFLKTFAGDNGAKKRTGGVSDLNSHRYDARTQYLIHDLVYPFNTLISPPDNPDTHAEELAREVSQNVIPFYITAQSLLFSKTILSPGKSDRYVLKVPKPSNDLPPSYNTKSTGATGDTGLVSIGYSLIVGVSEEINGQLTPRNMYFPFEFRSGKKGWDREWLQADYLQEPVVDTSWETEVRGKQKEKPNTKGSKEKLLRDIDTLIESDVQVVAANERRKSSVSKPLTENKGLISQLPAKLRVSYQIRVNGVALCTLTMSKPFYHVGDDVHFFLDVVNQHGDCARVVGYYAYVEAHEIFNLPEKKQFVNTYKVTPTVKTNLLATALAAHWDSDSSPVSVSNMLNLPRHATQQFQSSAFMDLRYFFVCKFLLNDFTELSGNNDIKGYADYLQEYKFDNEGTEFKFAIPLVVLP
ncbi:hypothetical protein CJI97_004431 [Candidozyma auris]|nr:hypothetical protein CJI97_004431 [[Candida] auris]